MKLIKPSYEILTFIEPDIILKRIEIAGRTCYKSEDTITTESAKDFVKMIIKRGHESVLEHQSITVKFICDRGVSHEIVRHRIASFSQESTRYCNYSKDKFDNQLTFIIPCWINIPPGSYNRLPENYEKEEGTEEWLSQLLGCEESYLFLIDSEWQPQQARSILPNSLKTEIVVTANLREWRTIFKQRTSVAAHPQMRELMCPLLDDLKQKISVIFDDIIF